MTTTRAEAVARLAARRAARSGNPDNVHRMHDVPESRQPPDVPESGPAPPGVLRVLAHVHSYPPEHNAGGEYAMHAVLRRLVANGHEARVLTELGRRRASYQGVEVMPRGWVGTSPAQHRWAHVIITHLDMTQVAAEAARSVSRPLVHYVHNHRQLRWHDVLPEDAALVAFNSEWLAERVKWQGRTAIVRPHVDVDEYQRDTSREYVTLVNLNAEKGGQVLQHLAMRMPSRKFLGVKGSYGRQIARSRSNLKIAPNAPGIQRWYARTRVLLMPSTYESWGRVAVEAACSGIPTIASPTPGLQEALGDAGVFVGGQRARRDWRPWAEALERLDDPAEYARASAAARARALELEKITAADLAAFEKALMQIGSVE